MKLINNIILCVCAVLSCLLILFMLIMIANGFLGVEMNPIWG